MSIMTDDQLAQFKAWLEEAHDPPLTRAEIRAARDWFAGDSQFWFFRCTFTQSADAVEGIAF